MEGADVGMEVMSEVHLGCPPGSSGLHLSHFTIFIPPDVDDAIRHRFVKDEVPPNQTLCVDEDGDLVITRRTGACRVSIQHNITSSIPNVGLQVWKAELLLSDFVLHKSFTSSEFDGIISLELGAGTGLVGMLLARVARTVFVTDRGDNILDNCIKNVQLNSEVLNYKGAIHVRKLDWMNSWPPPGSMESSSCIKRYSWTPSEVVEAQRASLLVAADVIYNDDLTDALFRILERLMSQGSEKNARVLNLLEAMPDLVLSWLQEVLYLALEKRYNFSLDDLDVVAKKNYSHFRSYVGEKEEGKGLEPEESFPTFTGKCIDLSLIPQYVRDYERGDDLELWQIKYHATRQEQ